MTESQIPRSEALAEILTRFWYRVGASYQIDERGYLADPEAPYGHILNPNVVTSDKFDDVPCVVLLGSQGLGKSTFLAAEEARRVTSDGDSNIDCIRIDLRTFQTDGLLVNSILTNPRIVEWQRGSGALRILLDSFDEGLRAIPQLVDILCNLILQQLPVERLQLRIASRPIEAWTVLEKHLHRFWPEGIQSYLLAPLRRVDVRFAVTNYPFNILDFEEALIRSGAGRHAAVPITLAQLARVFARDGRFPEGSADLAAKSCLYLCEATDRARLLTREQQFVVVSRIAFVTVFSNRPVVVSESPLPGEVSIDDLLGGTETTNGAEFAVYRPEVDEALLTGFFEPIDGNRRTWRSYGDAEFLAAKYLVDNNVAGERLLGLLPMLGTRDGQLVPQLYQAAAWLATTERVVFDSLVISNPGVLLQADLDVLDGAQREKLVRALLERHGSGEGLRQEIPVPAEIDRLAFPGIADVLRPFLSDESIHLWARHVAVEIGKRLCAADLRDELLGIALNEHENLDLRADAISALAALDDSDLARQLEHLAVGVTEDQRDELKGNALKVLWPALWTTPQLLENLTSPRQANFAGAYDSFLYSLPSKLSADDLESALRWVSATRETGQAGGSLGSLAKGIINQAWECLISQPQLAHSMSEAVASLFERHRMGFGKDYPRGWGEDDERRHMFLGAVLEHGEPSLVDRIESHLRQLFRIDMQWLFERIASTTSRPEFVEAFKVASLIVHPADCEMVRKLAAAIIANSTLPTEAEVSRARNLLEACARSASVVHPESVSDSSVSESSPIETSESVATAALTASDQVTSAMWLRFVQLSRQASGPVHWFSSDIPSFWKTLDEPTQMLVVKGAKEFLDDRSYERAKWRAAGLDTELGRAAFLALQVAGEAEDEDCAAFAARWVDLLLCVDTDSQMSEDSRLRLIDLAHQTSGDHVVDVFAAMIRRHSLPCSFEKVAVILREHGDTRGVEAIVAGAADNLMDLPIRARLIRSLANLDVEGAVDVLANELADLSLALEDHSSTGEVTSQSVSSDRELAVALAATLLGLRGGWQIVRPLMESDPLFGKQVLTRLRQGDLVDRLRGSCSPRELGELIVWTHSHVPIPPGLPSQWGGPSAELQLTWMKDSLLAFLESSGTTDGVEAVAMVTRAFPSEDRFRRSLRLARSNLAAAVWEPLLPRALLEYVRQVRVRIANTPDDLVRLVIESLRRLEARLQGETPAIRDLWDRQRVPSQFEPTDENHLSDYVKRHLQQEIGDRGIVFAREVEVHPPKSLGPGSGERTDIHIDAFRRDSSNNRLDLLTVILETKGCWNGRVSTAMKTQLEERYLRRDGHSHGIYLIGRYDCSHWTTPNLRHPGSCPPQSEMQDFYDAQASSLSVDGVYIRAVVIDLSLPGSPATRGVR